MRLSTRLVTNISLVLLFAFVIAGCSKKEQEKKVGASSEAPLSAGYEKAIAAHASKPIFRPAGTGPAVWGPGDLYALLATGKETNNAFFQFEAIVPPGGGPPPHIHSREDESFYIVRGSLEMSLGDSTVQAKAGDFVFIPRGTAHHFKNVGKDTAVQLVTFVPAGMENYFIEVFPVASDRSAAPPPVTEDLIRKLHEHAPKYGLEFLPPKDSGKN
ncbi:MAG: cupin domain-containing protein [Sulfuricaulis sp.]|nr:cupin domain-containing protein [Sulfuricaulis sp.]